MRSAFLQNEWKHHRWGILIGGRLDKHSLIDNPVFSPRANIRYNPTKDINLRASYSTGFRAPQAFDEDLHVENVQGTVAMVQQAADLSVENYRSISVSSDIYHRWGAFQGNFMIDGFHTILNDVFFLENIGLHDQGSLITERRIGSGT